MRVAGQDLRPTQQPSTAPELHGEVAIAHLQGAVVHPWWCIPAGLMMDTTQADSVLLSPTQRPGTAPELHGEVALAHLQGAVVVHGGPRGGVGGCGAAVREQGHAVEPGLLAQHARDAGHELQLHHGAVRLHTANTALGLLLFSCLFAVET